MDEKEDLFRDLCENTPDLVQSVSPDGRFRYVNRAWLETLGYAREDLPGLSVIDIIHPDSRAHCQEVFRRLMEGEPVRRVEATFVTRDGRRIPVEGSVSCRIEEGRPFATRGIFRDITDRVDTEEELSRLFLLSIDMLCVAGTDGYFKQINPAFERNLGYTKGELLSRQFLEFIHPDDRDATLQRMAALARGEPVVDFQNRYRRKDGSWRWLAWRSAPLASRGLIYAVARDVTEERHTRELLGSQAAELERSNADLEQFASAASHDLRAPLRAVASLAEWIAEEADLPEKAVAHLEELRTRVGQMQDLVDHLLAYARAGRGDEDSTPVETAGVARQLVRLMGVPDTFDVHVEPGMPVLQTARAPFEQVLRNLIGNAVSHHDRPAGHVSIGARPAGDFWEFRVTDDGPGIPQRFQERAFDLFERGKASARSGGAGMGLSLVKRVVEHHGGSVRLESHGRGTTVAFTWPARPVKERS